MGVVCSEGSSEQRARPGPAVQGMFEDDNGSVESVWLCTIPCAGPQEMTPWPHNGSVGWWVPSRAGGR